MKNMKIGSRLGLGFGVILVIMIAMVVIGVNRLAKVNAASTDMAENRIPKVLMVQDVQEQMGILARSIRNALLLKDREDIKKELGRVQQARKQANEVFAKFDKVMVTPKGREMLKSVLDARAPYGVAVDKLAKMIEAGQTEDARDFMLKDVRTVQAAYFERLEAFQKYFVDAMNKGNQEADDAYQMARMILMGMGAAAVVLGIIIAISVTRSITQPINEAVKVAETVASGDLTSRIDVKSTDETGQLMQALKNMNDSLLGIVSQVRLGTDTIATASAQIAAGNQDLSSRTEEQASSLEETASSMEEMTSTVRQNGDNAQQANQLARTASDIATKGGAVVAEVVQTMGAINESSKKMADIINVIDGIAFQTNILALNAAVEAARAGEQGRGFAVVATEVRNLAQRSAGAAREIKTLIDDSVSKVGEGTKLVDQAGATMTEIVSSIQRVPHWDGVFSRSGRSARHQNKPDTIGHAIAGKTVRIYPNCVSRNFANANKFAPGASGDFQKRGLGRILIFNRPCEALAPFHFSFLAFVARKFFFYVSGYHNDHGKIRQFVHKTENSK